MGNRQEKFPGTGICTLAKYDGVSRAYKIAVIPIAAALAHLPAVRFGGIRAFSYPVKLAFPNAHGKKRNKTQPRAILFPKRQYPLFIVNRPTLQDRKLG